MRCNDLLIALMSLTLVGCGGPRCFAEREDFQADPRHHREFSGAPAPVCAAARRVLLADGYVLQPGSGESLVGAKEFQGEDKTHAMLRLYVSCETRTDGSTLFLTATEEHFDVKTSRQSTSVGVPLISPLAVTSKTEVDNQVKIRGETVTSRAFYERFYRAVARELNAP